MEDRTNIKNRTTPLKLNDRKYPLPAQIRVHDGSMVRTTLRNGENFGVSETMIFRSKNLLDKDSSAPL